MAAAQNVSDRAESVDASASTESPNGTDTTSKTASVARKSLEERSKIPNSFYVTVIGFCAMAYFGNVFRVETIHSWMNSVLMSAEKVHGSLVYSQEVAQSLIKGERRPLSEYAQVSFITLSILSLLYIFVWAPFRAGFWTGTRSSRHVVHRYMGLAYMAQYFLAWFEFSTNYEETGRSSFLPMFIALNGKFPVIMQSPRDVLCTRHVSLLMSIFPFRYHSSVVGIFFVQGPTRADGCWLLLQ